MPIRGIGQPSPRIITIDLVRFGVTTQEEWKFFWELIALAHTLHKDYIEDEGRILWHIHFNEDIDLGLGLPERPLLE